MLNPWDVYTSRMANNGANTRSAVFNREVDYLRRKLPNSLSYHSAVINGEQRNVAIINSDNLNEKTICSMPLEDLPNGGLVYWMDNYWLITEKDANNELYTRAKLIQCNYNVSWINREHQIVSRWCIIADGTKYLTGEWSDNYMVLTRGDSRLVMTLPRDSETVRLNRQNRFILDDFDSPEPIAYRLTKPFKLGHTFQDEGVLMFVLSECNTEDDDNLELHIADYYTYFPREDDEDDTADTDIEEPEGGESIIDETGNDDTPATRRSWL